VWLPGGHSVVSQVGVYGAVRLVSTADPSTSSVTSSTADPVSAFGWTSTLTGTASPASATSPSAGAVMRATGPGASGVTAADRVPAEVPTRFRARTATV